MGDGDVEELGELRDRFDRGRDLAVLVAADEVTPEMTKRSLADLIAHADELADAFENHEPAPEELDAPLPPLMAVNLVAFRRAAADEELAEAIAAARQARLSWRQVGEAIGTTGEAARQRHPASWPARAPAPHGPAT